MIIRSSSTIKGVSRVYKPLIHLLHSFLITEESTPKSFFRWFFFLIFVFIIYFFELFIVYCGWFFIEVFILFLFRYIFMLHLCRLFPFLLLISIFRLSSKCCFLYINILSLINRRIKRIIKSSFFL